MTERNNGNQKIEKMLSPLNLSEDSQYWIQDYWHTDILRDSVTGLQRLGLAQTTEQAFVIIDHLMNEAPLQQVEFYHVSDQNQVRNRRHRNVSRKWKIRDLVNADNGTDKIPSSLNGRNFYQFGSKVHQAVSKLYSTELPPNYLNTTLWDDFRNPKSDSKKIEDILDKKQNVLSEIRLQEFNRLLSMIYGSEVRQLIVASTSQDTATANLFLESLGRVAVDYYHNGQPPVLFREVKLPLVTLDNNQPSIYPGQADGVYIKTIDNRSVGELSSEELLTMRNISRRGSKPMLQTLQSLNHHFPGSEIVFGIWELKTHGDQERGVISRCQIEFGPRENDLWQVKKYSVLLKKAFRDLSLSNYDISEYRLDYALSDKLYKFLGPIGATEVDEVLSSQINDQQMADRNRIRQKEKYLLNKLEAIFKGQPEMF